MKTTQKIPLYRVRTFSEKLSDSVDFMTQNRKPLLRLFLYVLLPFCLVLGWSNQAFWEEYIGAIASGASNLDDSEVTSLGIGYIVTMVFMVFGLMMVLATIYAAMKLYGEREDGLDSLAFKDAWPRIRRNLGRLCIILLVFLLLYFVMVGVVALLAVASLWTLLAMVPALFFVLFCLSLLPPVYLFEDSTGIVDAVKKSLRYGYHTFGGLLALLIVLGILLQLVGGVLSIPMVVLMFVKVTLFPGASAASAGVGPVLLSVVTYAVSVFTIFAVNLLYSIVYVGLAYQYGHAADKLDGVSVSEDIAHFDDFADHNEDAPETRSVASDIEQFDRL